MVSMARREVRTYRATAWARAMAWARKIVPELLAGLGLTVGMILLPILAGVIRG